MQSLYPPYDFLFIGILTFLLSYLIRLGLNKIPRYSLLTFDSSLKFPFLATSYLIISLSFAFIWNELPLKFYADLSYDFETQIRSEGPNIGAGLVRGFWYRASIFLNLFLWIRCVIALFVFVFLKSKKERSEAVSPKDLSSGPCKI